jgi:hypothetical protein
MQFTGKNVGDSSAKNEEQNRDLTFLESQNLEMGYLVANKFF